MKASSVTMLQVFILSYLASMGLSFILSGQKTSKKTNYELYCYGNCDNDFKADETLPGVVLMGGGVRNLRQTYFLLVLFFFCHVQTDTDEAFTWQISRAGKGDFVVLRATGTDAYNSYIYDLSVRNGLTLNTVKTLVLKNRDASSEKAVLEIVQNAEAIFFAGGNQDDYVNFWIGTELQTIIQCESNAYGLLFGQFLNFCRKSSSEALFHHRRRDLRWLYGLRKLDLYCRDGIHYL